jgi:hypothetical protein
MKMSLAVTAPQDFASPQWDKATKCGDWKNYINESLRKVWESFNAAQQMLIAANAQEQADQEDWE